MMSAGVRVPLTAIEEGDKQQTSDRIDGVSKLLIVVGTRGFHNQSGDEGKTEMDVRCLRS